MADLAVSFCGVRFKNPVVAASAEPTLNAENMRRCLEAGAGGVIAKTMTDSAPMRELTTRSKWRFLNERHEVCRGKIPRCFSLYGRSGLALEEPDVYMGEIRKALGYASAHQAVLIGSIASEELKGWVELARRMEDAGVPLVELNFGCPHPKMMPGVRTGMTVGQDFDYACEITEAVSDAISIPVMIKVTPQVNDLVEFSGRLLEAGASAVTLTNRFLGFVPDIETGKPLIYGWAGIGGPWTKPLTLNWISRIHCRYNGKIFIAGTNGAYDWRDIVMFIMSGAHIVELCSAVMAHGYEWLGRQVRAMEIFMDQKRYRRLEDIRGVAADKALSYAEMPSERARIDSKLCNRCGRCLRVCFYRAMQEAQEHVWVDEDACVGCGACYSVCPVEGAIEILTKE